MTHFHPLAAAFLVAAVAAPSPILAEESHRERVEFLCFSPDGTQLISGAHDGLLKWWDCEAGELLATRDEHSVMVSGGAFAPDGNAAVTVGWGAEAIVWGPDAQLRRRYLEHTGVLYAVAISPDGEWAATGGNDKTVRIWSLADGTERRTIVLKDPLPSALAVSPDAGLLAVGTRRRTVQLWRLPEGDMSEFELGGRVSALRFTADGSRLLVAAGRSVQAWDVETREKVREFESKRAKGSFGYAPGGPLVVPDHRKVLIWRDMQAEAPEAFAAGDFVAAAVSPDGETVALATEGGRIELRSSQTGDVLHVFKPAKFAAPVPKDVPLDDGILGKNLMRSDVADEFWTFDSETDAFQWRGAPDARALHMRAVAVPSHVVGSDRLTGVCGIGTRSFDLTCEVNPARVAGPGVFQCGWLVGLASAPPHRASDEDMTVFMGMHFNGIAAGALKGVPYASRHNYTNLRRAWIHKFGGDRIGYSRTAKGTFLTDHRLRFRIRRDGANRIRFAAWCPYADQSAGDPWWEGVWQVPEAWANVPLNYLVIKRIPLEGVHLGAQGIGYEDIFEMDVEMTSLRLSIDPPVVNGAAWTTAVLEKGDTVTLRGEHFPEAPVVRFGGVAATQVSREDAGKLSVQLPDLPPGRAYRLWVGSADPDQPGAYAERRIPVGRLLTRLELVDSLPAGGDVLTLHGAGFEEDTRVFFGEQEAEVVGAASRTALRVRVPPHGPGGVRVTARTGEAVFADPLHFGYTPRPSLWFDEREIKALREVANDDPRASYRHALVKAAEAGLKRNPSTGGRKSHETMSVLTWAYALTEREDFRDAAVRWANVLAANPKYGGWSGWTVTAVAFTYDVTAPAMSIEQRATVQEFLLGALDHYAEAERWYDWFITNNSSTNPLCNAAGMAAAAALQNVRPDANQIMDDAKEHLTNYIETAFGPDGGCTEGLFRSGEGLTDYLLAAHLLARHAGDRALLDHDRLAHVPKLYRTLAVTPTKTLPFKDTHEGFKGVAVCAQLAARHSDLFLLELADRLANRNAKAGETGFALLWRGDARVPDGPAELSDISVLADVQEGVLRSAASADADFVVGLKGGQGPLPYHRQKDLGSLCVFAFGEPVVRERGWGKREPQHHSVPVIDGHGPTYTGASIVDQWSDKEWRLLVLDSTRAYPENAVARVRRTVLLHRDGVVVILDDVAVPHDVPGQVVSRFQVNDPTLEVANSAAFVEGENAAARITFHGPPTELSTDVWKGRHGRGGGKRTVNATYTASEEAPLVTVMALGPDIETVQNGPAPEVRRQGDRIAVKMRGKQRVLFKRIADGWAVVPPGRRHAPRFEKAPADPEALGTCARAKIPPTLDGRLDDAVWAAAQPLSAFVDAEAWGHQPARYQTEVRLAYDDEKLYAAFRCYEPELDGVHSPRVSPAQSLALDDRLLFLLDPDNAGKSPVVYGMDLPANGENLGANGKHGDLGSAKFEIVAGREEAPPKPAWVLEVAWPWKEILFDPWHRLQQTEPPKPGTRMGLNIQRTRVQEPYELSVWRLAHPYAIAAPARWGEVVFE